MSHLQKLRTFSVCRRVCLCFNENKLVSSKTNLWAPGSYLIAQSPRLYGSENAVESENNQDKDEKLAKYSRKYRIAKKEAQAALLEYLHSTRSLQYMDAEFISRNSPRFIGKLLRNVKDETNIAWAMTRFLRYHPINEFEPFFESMGLKPAEYSSFLPRDMMFLNDDRILLENYHALCNYGIPRNEIGKIYKSANEVFKYDYGVLKSKLESFEKMGLDKVEIFKVVISCPHILTGNMSREFHKVLEKLNAIGIDSRGWIGLQLSEKNSYSWSHMLALLCLFNKIGFRKKTLRSIICLHPGLLFELSGDRAFSLIVLLFKFGYKDDKIYSALMNFPRIEVGKFVSNLRQCIQFFIEIEMDAEDIGSIVRSHLVLLGSCSLKKVTSILSCLNTGKKRLCGIIKENPLELKNLVFGRRVTQLPKSEDEQISQVMKTKFLLDLGFAENSNEMKKALMAFRGKGLELQERFNCLLNAGLSREDVIKMLKVSPQVLNQSKDVIEKKINVLVSLGLPLSSLVLFPSYLSYTSQRVKLRYSMYCWLRDQGKVDPELSLSTIVSTSDKIFTTKYVTLHHKGPKIWEKLKKEIYRD